MPNPNGNSAHISAPPIEELLYLIKPVALRMYAKLPKHVRLEDLEQAGYLGLHNALANFKLDRENTLLAYVRQKIRYAILDYLRELDPNSRHARARHNKLQHNKLQKENPNEASQLVRLMQLGALNQDDETIAGTFDPPDTTTPNPERILLLKERRALIQEAILELDDRQKLILELYVIQGLQMHEIASLLDLEESRISQIIKQIKFKLAPFFYGYRLGSY